MDRIQLDDGGKTALPQQKISLSKRGVNPLEPGKPEFQCAAFAKK
jgi:hypothetical protein